MKRTTLFQKLNQKEVLTSTTYESQCFFGVTRNEVYSLVHIHSLTISMLQPDNKSAVFVGIYTQPAKSAEGHHWRWIHIGASKFSARIVRIQFTSELAEDLCTLFHFHAMQSNR